MKYNVKLYYYLFQLVTIKFQITNCDTIFQQKHCIHHNYAEQQRKKKSYTLQIKGTQYATGQKRAKKIERSLSLEVYV